ncbi:MAG TPA: membrane protein insertion efficiency factor YidD, partial [Beijerinckiaceae bacterium]|nr:membrane protein insertion efficiency factor YidD [Beijerinckiaceae bacterium]
CSEYTDEAIGRHGVWAGGWMGFARICRCGPLGTSGIDLVCEEVPPHARWYAPWRYGRWRGVNAPPDRHPAADASDTLAGDTIVDVSPPENQLLSARRGGRY